MSEKKRNNRLKLEPIPFNSDSLAAIDLLSPKKELASLLQVDQLTIRTERGEEAIDAQDTAALHLFLKALHNSDLTITISTIPPYIFEADINPLDTSYYLVNELAIQTPQHPSWLEFCRLILQAIASN